MPQEAQTAGAWRDVGPLPEPPDALAAFATVPLVVSEPMAERAVVWAKHSASAQTTVYPSIDCGCHQP